MMMAIIVFGSYFVAATILLFLLMMISNTERQDPMTKKWFNRTEEGSRFINQLIADGWDYTHDPDARYAYYEKNGDGWSVTVRADQVWIWQEDEGELVFEFPWCDDESSHKFAELAVLGMTDHNTQKVGDITHKEGESLFDCPVVVSNKIPKDRIFLITETLKELEKNEN